jgi:uncharacterized OB-fold protein
MTGAMLPEHAGFMASFRQGRLAFPRCRDCGRCHWYPMPRCPHCRSSSLDWHPVAGPGRVYSFTIVRHAFEEKWRPELPYIVALVEFADAPGVRLITNLVGIAPDAVAIGLDVVPDFTAGDRLIFRPAS